MSSVSPRACPVPSALLLGPDALGSGPRAEQAATTATQNHRTTDVLLWAHVAHTAIAVSLSRLGAADTINRRLLQVSYLSLSANSKRRYQASRPADGVDLRFSLCSVQ